MPFGDFVERGVERVKIKLGLAGNRATPSFDDLHVAIGEALQHVADEAPAPAPAAPQQAAPARDLDQAVWDRIDALVEKRVAAAIASLPAPAPAAPAAITVLDKPSDGLPPAPSTTLFNDGTSDAAGSALGT